MKIVAIVHEAKEGGYWAEVPALPGAYTQAETLEELQRNIREAVEPFLEDETEPLSAGPETDERAFRLVVAV